MKDQVSKAHAVIETKQAVGVPTYLVGRKRGLVIRGGHKASYETYGGGEKWAAGWSGKENLVKQGGRNLGSH